MVMGWGERDIEPLGVGGENRTMMRQAALMAVLLGCYVVLSLVFVHVIGEPDTHPHFAYIPLVLAGLWWG